MVVDQQGGQRRPLQEALPFGLVLGGPPQTLLVCPVEPACKGPQARCLAPAEEVSERGTPAPVQLHSLNGLWGREEDQPPRPTRVATR